MEYALGICSLCRRLCLLYQEICEPCMCALESLLYRTRTGHWCERCGAPLLHPDAICMHDTAVDTVIRLMPYTGTAKRLLMQYRDHQVRSLVHTFHYLLQPTLLSLGYTMIIPVPVRPRIQGWDHLRYLAKRCRSALIASESLVHMNSMCPDRGKQLLASYDSVVVLQDVYTAESSLHSYIETLRKVSGRPVFGLCIMMD